MKIWILVLNTIIYIKISEAQSNRNGFIPPTPPPTPGPKPIPPAPTPRTETSIPPPLPWDGITPKCYPETAKAYFLPAPPTQPKVTVLDPTKMAMNVKEQSNFKQQPLNFKETPLNLKETSSNFKEITSNFKNIPSTVQETPLNFKGVPNSNRPSIIPPPAYVPVLPELVNEMPTLVQDRYSRLAESEVKVCSTCANLIEKLPIFKFDQELLQGFLAGLGL